MKILLNCHMPFLLAHGGAQIQIEQTKAALDQIGVQVEYLRWWDEKQTGDILHQIGWLDRPMMALAQQRGWKVAMTILLTEQCNRPWRELLPRKLLIRSALAVPFASRLKERLRWSSYHLCDRMIVGLEAERMILADIYGVPRERIEVVPLGLAKAWLDAGPGKRNKEHLICTGTIGPAKNSVALAQLAHAAGTPLLFVGKPFDFQSSFWKEFEKLIDGKIVKHHQHVASQEDLIGLLQHARGYVLMSRNENWSLAAHEAAAAGLPMLVPDQRWSRERFGDRVSYWPKKGRAAAVSALRRFYDQCPSLSPPGIHLHSWVETAERLRDIYTQMLHPRN
jgi:glycosyltransferase involved in cell wall biosynthesis